MKMMPELPEAEITRRILRPRIIGKRLAGFWTDLPSGLKSAIALKKIPREIEGVFIRDLRRKGKVLFMELDSAAGLSFAIHLRMSGALLFGKPFMLAGRANKEHVHFIWKFGDGNDLWLRDPRKFATVWYGTKDEFAKDKYLSSLGSDAPKTSLSEFRRKIRQHRGRIKPLLLRQDVIAGLGNITVDDALWEAKLQPVRLTKTLSDKEIKNLHFCILKVLECAIKAEGNTMRDWVMPDGRRGRAVVKWKAYGREGEPCPRCGSKIKKITVGGRGTHFCPVCQKAGNE